MPSPKIVKSITRGIIPITLAKKYRGNFAFEAPQKRLTKSMGKTGKALIARNAGKLSLNFISRIFCPPLLFARSLFAKTSGKHF